MSQPASWTVTVYIYEPDQDSPDWRFLTDPLVAADAETHGRMVTKSQLEAWESARAQGGAAWEAAEQEIEKAYRSFGF